MKNFLAEEGKRIDAQHDVQRQTIRETSGQSSFTQTQVANDGSRSSLDGKEVSLSERRAAEDAIQRQDIPAGYREYLRNYFERLQPDDARKSQER